MILEKEIEVYGLIKDLDKSILRLNPIIEGEGYKFIALTYTEILTVFSKVFEFKWIHPSVLGSISSSEKVNQEFFFLKKSENPTVQLEEDKSRQIGYKLITEKSPSLELAQYLSILSFKLSGANTGHINFQGAISILKDSFTPVDSFLPINHGKRPHIFPQIPQPSRSTFKLSISDENLSRLALYNSGIIKQAEKKYRKAIDNILKRNRVEFSNALKDAFEILPSGLDRFHNNNEFSRIIEKEISIGYLESCKWIRDELSLGFLHLGMKNYEEAYDYLSKEINLDLTDDLPYLLRGMIPGHINPNCREDITTAYFLRPSSRALFLHYSFLYENVLQKEKSKNQLLHFLNRIIQQSPDPIIYLMRSNYRYAEERDEDILNSYYLDPNYVPALKRYAFLSGLNKEEHLDCLLKLKKHGIEHPTAIANAYFNLKNYKAALEYYESIPIHSLIGSSIDFADINGLKSVVEIHDEHIIPMNAFSYFESRSYGSYHLLNYLICLIKKHNPNFRIGSENPIYTWIANLQGSFIYKDPRNRFGPFWGEDLEKLIESGKISEEEVNAPKLMLYQLTSKIGFGAQKGKRLGEILKECPGDIINKILNLVHFSVHPYVFFDERIKANPKFLEALEVNLIKVNILADRYDFYNADDGYYDHYSSEDSYYDGGGGDEWSDPFQFSGG